MGFSFSGAAAGATDALEQMMVRKRAEYLQQQMLERQAQQDARQAQQDAANAAYRDEQIGMQRKQFDAGRQDKADATAKTAKGEADTSAFINTLPAAVRPMVELRRRGVTGVTQHDLETPEAHQAHVTQEQGAEDRRKIDLYQRERQIDAQNRAPATPPAPKSKIWITRGGMPTYVDPEQVQPGDAPYQQRGQKTPTGADRQAFAFYNRAKKALDTIEGGDPGKDMETQIAHQGMLGQAGTLLLPNAMQSQLGQSYRQAQRAFTEARLRKESGAAINDAEYAKDARTYFAQPGDTPQTIQQKRAARKQVVEGLAFASGPAYEEYFGEPFKAMSATVDPQHLGAVPSVKIHSITEIK